MTLSAWDELLLAPSFTSGEEGCRGEHPRPSAHIGQRLHVQLPQNTQKTFCSGWCNTSCRCRTSHSQFDTWQQVHNWHASSLRGSVAHLSRERIAQRDLEPNLSQTLHSFQLHSKAHNFHLKLIIFICKQLKKPVTFGTVQGPALQLKK